VFNRFNGKRNVNVNRNEDDWNDDNWFFGRRNSLHFRHTVFKQRGGFVF